VETGMLKQKLESRNQKSEKLKLSEAKSRTHSVLSEAKSRTHSVLGEAKSRTHSVLIDPVK